VFAVAEAVRVCLCLTVLCWCPPQHSAPATPCDPELTSELKRAARSTVAGGETTPVLMSGAGHDAMAMARLAKTGMLFVRCRGGVSHSPEEFVADDDIWAAGLALVSFLEQNVVEAAEHEQGAVVAEA
jgi:allantoate deiminase